MDQQPPSPATLYESDSLAWAEQQAVLLAQLADGATPKAAIDWIHVIEEVRDLGLSELRACSSLLTQAMVHLLKLRAWPQSQAAPLWREEIRRFLDDAEDRFTPSIRQRIVLDSLHAKALRRVGAASDASGAALAVPDQCPFTLDDLLRGEVEDLSSQLV